MGLETAAIIGIAGGAAGLLGGTASTIAGSKSNKYTNDMNFRINQMNNEFNQKMLEKQLSFNKQENDTNRQLSSEFFEGSQDFQREMFDKQNEYMTPSAQRQRIEEAGYNPNLMLPNAGVSATVGSVSGSTPSSQGSGLASSSGQAVMRPYQPPNLGQAVMDGVQAYASYKTSTATAARDTAEAKQINTETQYIGQKIMSEIYKDYAEADSSKQKARYQEIINQYQDQISRNHASQSAQDLLNSREVFKSLQIQVASDTLKFSYLPEQLRLGVADAAASVALKIAQGEMTRYQGKYYLAQSILSKAQASGQKVSNEIAFQTAGDVIESTWNQTEILRKENNYWISPREKSAWGLGSSIGAGTAAGMITKGRAGKPMNLNK
jgi:hypothetical protein